MSRTRKFKPSNVSQRIDDDAWYYEAAGSIHVVVWIKTPNGKVVRSFRIRARQLLETAKRCGWRSQPRRQRPSSEAGQ